MDTLWGVHRGGQMFESFLCFSGSFLRSMHIMGIRGILNFKYLGGRPDIYICLFCCCCCCFCCCCCCCVCVCGGGGGGKW